MKNVARNPKHTSFINVKIPEFFTEIIDRNLENGKLLHTKGFSGRSHFVRTVVVDELIRLALLSKEEAQELAERSAWRKRRNRRIGHVERSKITA